MAMDIASLRVEYSEKGIDRQLLSADGVEQFKRWLQEAVTAQVTEPNAMVLATVDASGQPHGRCVLLKQVDESGFGFFTNYESGKSQQLDIHPKASLTFSWLELQRQVRVVGTAAKMASVQSDDYWKRRSFGAQLGSAASQQSSLLSSREALEEQYRALEEKYKADQAVPRPPTWGGWLLQPTQIEFWQGRSNRLHDRYLYELDNEAKTWKIKQLAP